MRCSTMDSAKIADDVYKIAESDELIAPLVKEAIAVIEQALDTHGWVLAQANARYPCNNIQGRIAYP